MVKYPTTSRPSIAVEYAFYLRSLRPSSSNNGSPRLSVCPPVTRQKPQINGFVVLGADESLWPCGTPSWYTPLSWIILSKQKNLHPFPSQYICVFLSFTMFLSLYHHSISGILAIDRSDIHTKVKVKGQGHRSQNKFWPNLDIFGL